MRADGSCDLDGRSLLGACVMGVRSACVKTHEDVQVHEHQVSKGHKAKR